MLVGGVAAADPEGFDPCPVRITQPTQVLFLGMSGDRTGVLDAGHSLLNPCTQKRLTSLGKYEKLRAGYLNNPAGSQYLASLTP